MTDDIDKIKILFKPIEINREKVIERKENNEINFEVQPQNSLLLQVLHHY